MGQLYLVNAPARATRKRAKRKPSAKQVKARAKFARMAKARSARAASAKSFTRQQGASMAKRKRKAPARKAAPRRKRRVQRKRPGVSLARRGVTVYRSNPRRKVRRRVRRNPSLAKGIVGSIMQGAKDGAFVIGGVAATNFISRRIPLGNGSVPVEALKKVAVGVALSMLVGKAMGRAAGEKVMVGAVVAVGMDLLRNVPVVGTSLAGDADLAFIRRTIGAYPTPMTAIGAYPDTMGALPDEMGSARGALSSYL